MVQNMLLARRLGFLVVMWFALVGGAMAIAEPRIALVIGNGKYTSVGSLDNPVPDAELMAKTLESKGFTVSLLTDTTQSALNRGIAKFGRDLRQAGPEATGLFFYAGHGVQSFGSNFLLPVDAQLTDAADLGLVAIQADTVLRQMFSARNKTNIVILDACRNNPFENILELNDNGLAEMKAPTGTFLSYSTSPGAVALDGLDGNSPFTKALASRIPSPGIQIEQLFKEVRIDVLKQTQGQQTPWDTSSLTGDFFFVAQKVLTAEEAAEKQLWDSVSKSKDALQLMLFLRGYPKGQFSDEAREMLNEAMRAEVQTAEPEPEPVVKETPKTVDPKARERELINVAQQSGLAADYEVYLSEFPSGVYAELAKFELDIIAKKLAKVDVPERPTEQTRVADQNVTFTDPIDIGVAALNGQSLEQLILHSPLFSPIEGIPDSVWKDKTCSNCHEWTRDALCDQGNTYMAANAERALGKQHPFGGGFKNSLKNWAGNECR